MNNFEFKQNENYFMPVSLLPPGKDERDALVGAHYRENQRYKVAYKTDREKVQSLLPPGFIAKDPAVISICFAECRGIDYLAGGGYNLVCVDVDVEFKGQRDYAEGSYALVLWMNKFYPILLGRELLGAAKLMAEVPDANKLDDEISFYAAEEGTRLLEGKLWGFKEKSKQEIDEMVKAGEGKCWLGYKHFPAVDLKGADISYATYLPTENVIKKAWKAEGEFRFLGGIDWKRAPLSWNVANTLSELPILEYVSAEAWTESSIYMPNRKLL
ncbi:hypothetical protein D7X98_11860 [bacterium 1XD8-76]|nr:hypothetical protein D7X98_11860 [bacterium 1XD8-76]